MKINSLLNWAYARNLKIRKTHAGITTSVSAAILISAVSILGSVVLIWANTAFTAEQVKIGDYYEKNSNLLKENYIIEDVWLSKNPANYVNVTLRNVGDITIDIKKIEIFGLKADDTVFTSATAYPPFTGNPPNSDGVVFADNTLRIDVSYTWNDPANIKSLDISVTTERNSMERIIWKVQ